MKKSPLIAVIDYGMGNIRSVSKALELVGAKVVVSDKPKVISSADAAVFPGVGAFGHAIKNLKRSGLDKAIDNVISQNKCFLGLCLGFQLLFDYSEEEGRHKGLGIIPGCVKKFAFSGSKAKLKIPHMGWNRVRCENKEAESKIFKGVPDNSYFYFVHSYYGKPKGRKTTAGSTEYENRFCSAVIKDRIWAFQFHPEKSSSCGLKVLKNFVGEVKKC